MRSGDAFVAIINYDPSGIVDKCAGLDPVGLVTYLKELIQPAMSQIERSQPDKYEAQGELHRIIWLKDRHNPFNLVTSIFRLFSSLVRELERANTEQREKGFPPATLHAGLSEGRVDFDARSVSGEGVVDACDCAEYARKTNSLLVISSGILKNVRPAIVQSVRLKSSIDGTREYVIMEEDALFAISR